VYTLVDSDVPSSDQPNKRWKKWGGEMILLNRLGKEEEYEDVDAERQDEERWISREEGEHMWNI